MITLMDNYDPTHPERELMDACGRRGWQLYQATGTLSHENDAWVLGEFVLARLSEREESPERDAFASIIASSVRTATYLSCGPKPITQALRFLVRAAHAFAAHPEYREEWKP